MVRSDYERVWRSTLIDISARIDLRRSCALAGATMAQKKSVPAISQETLDNRRCQFARILFLKQLDTTCQWVRKDLVKIWKTLESQIRAAVSALQDQVDDAFDPALEEIHAEYNSSVRRAVSISGLTMNVWSWYRSAPQGPGTLRSELEAAVRIWARKNRIEADWMINTAIENIAHWYESPAQEDRQGWFRPSVGMLGILTAEEAEFQFRLPRAWEPTFEKPTVARKRIKTAFKQALKEWMDRTEKLAKERGSKGIPKRSELQKHIGWLIRHRVLRQGYTKIAREDGLVNPGVSGRVTVTTGIESATKLIGFDPA